MYTLLPALFLQLKMRGSGGLLLQDYLEAFIPGAHVPSFDLSATVRIDYMCFLNRGFLIDLTC